MTAVADVVVSARLSGHDAMGGADHSQPPSRRSWRGASDPPRCLHPDSSELLSAGALRETSILRLATWGGSRIDYRARPGHSSCKTTMSSSSAGGDYVRYCDYYCTDEDDFTLFADGFTGRSPHGRYDGPSVLDTPTRKASRYFISPRQFDGRVVGVGRSVQDNRSKLTVFRLQPDGMLDPGFGDAGIVRYAPDERPYAASAVALDPDGRITVAGTGGGGLIVLRLRGWRCRCLVR